MLTVALGPPSFTIAGTVRDEPPAVRFNVSDFEVVGENPLEAAATRSLLATFRGEHEGMESLLEAAAKAGVQEAGYVLLRLPLEIKTLFREWLNEHQPDRARRVINRLQEMHQGADYRSEFRLRQTGSGPYAAQIAQRFRMARRRFGLDGERKVPRTDLFRHPVLPGGQLDLL